MSKQYGTPGPRALYPDICTSPSIAAVDPLGQLLFDRLLVLADDQGRVQIQPDWVKTNAVPFVAEATPRKVAAWLKQLSEHELLITYVANNVPLGQFVTWWNRQAGQRRAYPSRWPAPPGWDQDRTYGLPADGSPGALNDPKRGEQAPKVPAPRAHPAGELRAERGQDARSVPDQNPHSRAERAPGSVPLPVPPNGEDTTPPNPPRPRGGRMNGRVSRTHYDDLMVSDDDPEPTASGLADFLEHLPEPGPKGEAKR
jgi:hypothetical protein